MEKIEDTIKQRDAEYGGFENMALIGQSMKEIARDSTSWCSMRAYQREAVDMILHKLGRLLAGNPDNIDGWHDIQGYAKLVEDRLTNPPIKITIGAGGAAGASGGAPLSNRTGA
jgi:hypothetical protein